MIRKPHVWLPLLLIAVLAAVGARKLLLRMHSVEITWSPTLSRGAVSYQVYRMSGECPASPVLSHPVLVGTVPASAPHLVFDDHNVLPGRTYCYTIHTLAAKSESPDSTHVQIHIPWL